MTDTLEMPAQDSADHTLKAGVLGLFDSVIMGIAGVAPVIQSRRRPPCCSVRSCSVAGRVAVLRRGDVRHCLRLQLPRSSRAQCGRLLFVGAPSNPPGARVLSGWALIVSALIFMVAATVPAGANILGLFSSAAANNKAEVTIVGAIFFLAMVAAVAAGVTVTVTVQIVMSCIEIFLLILFAALAIFHGHHVHTFSWHWFSPGIFHGQSGFAAGALVAAFYYWGWDVTANLNEETKGAKKTRASGASSASSSCSCCSRSSPSRPIWSSLAGQITKNEADVLSVLGQQVWHGAGGKFIVLAVVLSTIATLETTLIQVTRTMFARAATTRCPKRSAPSTRFARPLSSRRAPLRLFRCCSLSDRSSLALSVRS